MQVSNFNSNREVISAALTVILKSHGLSFEHVVVKFESEKKNILNLPFRQEGVVPFH